MANKAIHAELRWPLFTLYSVTRRNRVIAVVRPFMLKPIVLYVCSAILMIVLHIQSAHADVGNCSVLFAYTPESPLDAKQQTEIGKRLLDAHIASSESDGHIAFICRIDTGDTGVKGKLYRIRETKVDGVTGYDLSAPSFDGLRLAVREVEQASKINSIYGLKSGAREKVSSAPFLKERGKR